MKIADKLRKAVRNSSSGHLSLCYRVELRNELSDSNLINKLYFECAKKVFPIWEAEYEGYTPVYEMLQKAHTYLYQNNGTQQDFLKTADSHKNYVEGISSIAGAAGLAALYLCYSIASGASFDEEYNGKDDDNAYDYEDWTPDYYAAMACSGAPPFFGEGDVEIRREFWLWFIDTADTLLSDQTKPILLLKELSPATLPDEHFNRTQTHKTEACEAYIQDTVAIVLALLDEHSIAWEQAVIELVSVSGITPKLSVINGGAKEKAKVDVIAIFSANFTRILDKVKTSMYEQCKDEGGWLSCALIANKDRTYSITFNYDSREVQERITSRSDESIVAEFRGYPRAKEFTPKWWQKLLGKKVAYLEK